jgi:hypothetical protein
MDKAKSKTRQFSFEALTDGRHFWFKTCPTEKADRYEQVLVDDTTYCLYQYATNPKLHCGEVNNRAFPRDDATGINYLWLAYASAGYLEPPAAKRLEPIWVLDDPNLFLDGFTQEAAWERFPGGLPRSIVYLNDGKSRTFDGHQSRIERWPAPFDRGFTNAVFLAGVSTNLGGLTVPLEFTFTRYGVLPLTGGTYDFGPVTITTAKVFNITSAPSRYSPPSFAGVADVVDLRSVTSNRRVPRAVYQMTNWVWSLGPKPKKSDS